MQGLFLKKGLSANLLKIIALVAMTVDHLGGIMFPDIAVFRIIGRIAYPIFAFMIAEGCCYSKHKIRYFALVLLVGAVCVLGFWVFLGRFYLNICITFSFSIAIVFTVHHAIKHNVYYLLIAPVLLILISALLSYCFTDLLDYGFFGAVIPVGIYLCKDFRLKLAVLSLGLILLELTYGAIQWYAFISVLLIAFYDGRRGKLNLKYLFYIYYPLHFVVLYGISVIV